MSTQPERNQTVEIEYEAPTIPLTRTDYNSSQWIESPNAERLYYHIEQGLHHSIDFHASGWTRHFSDLPFDLHVTHSDRETDDPYNFRICFSRDVIHLDISRWLDIEHFRAHVFEAFTKSLFEVLLVTSDEQYDGPYPSDRFLEYTGMELTDVHGQVFD